MLPADPGDASAAGVSLLAGWILLVVTLQANNIVLASTSFSRKHSRGTPLVVRFCKKLLLVVRFTYTNAMASAMSKVTMTRSSDYERIFRNG